MTVNVARRTPVLCYAYSRAISLRGAVPAPGLQDKLSPPMATGGACRQLPLSTGDYTTCVSL